MKPRVPRDWIDETVFLIAGGESVKDVDLSRLQGHRVVVVNSSYLAYPCADVLVFTDRRWWSKHCRRVRGMFGGEIVTLTPDHHDLFAGLHVYERQKSGGVSTDPTRLAWWHTSLTTAYNYIALRGASLVPTLGLDGKGSWHHEPHPTSWGVSEGKFHHHGIALATQVEPLRAMGTRVLNLNPNSAHRMFEFATLDDVLRQAVAA